MNREPENDIGMRVMYARDLAYLLGDTQEGEERSGFHILAEYLDRIAKDVEIAEMDARSAIAQRAAVGPKTELTTDDDSHQGDRLRDHQPAAKGAV